LIAFLYISCTCFPLSKNVQLLPVLFVFALYNCIYILVLNLTVVNAITSGHRSSPFGSSNSGSLCATPDPFSSDERQGSSGANLNAGRQLGAVSGSVPWKTAISENTVAPLRSTNSAESDSGLVTNMQVITKEISYIKLFL